MYPGLVSNCWRSQLSSGVDLVELIAEAADRGLQVIELRQGCLGSYESGDTDIPDALRLSELPQRFPSLSFSIAMSVPFLCELSSADDLLLDAGRSAAVAVAGVRQPHLRLVDLDSPFEIDGAVARTNLVRMCQGMESCDGVLSVEHAFQSWHGFIGALRSARGTLGRQQHRLRLCFDPCNLCIADAAVDVAVAARSLEPDEVSMIHFKQCRDGSVLSDVSDGCVNWRAIGDVLNSMPFQGPALFEVSSGSEIWTQISASRKYLEQLGLLLTPPH